MFLHLSFPMLRRRERRAHVVLGGSSVYPSRTENVSPRSIQLLALQANQGHTRCFIIMLGC